MIDYDRDFEEEVRLEKIKRDNNKILRDVGHMHKDFDNNMKAIKNVARAFNIVMVNGLGNDITRTLNDSVSILKDNLNQVNSDIQDAMYALKESMRGFE